MTTFSRLELIFEGQYPLDIVHICIDNTRAIVLNDIPENETSVYISVKRKRFSSREGGINSNLTIQQGLQFSILQQTTQILPYWIIYAIEISKSRFAIKIYQNNVYSILFVDI